MSNKLVTLDNLISFSELCKTIFLEKPITAVGSDPICIIKTNISSADFKSITKVLIEILGETLTSESPATVNGVYKSLILATPDNSTSGQIVSSMYASNICMSGLITVVVYLYPKTVEDETTNYIAFCLRFDKSVKSAIINSAFIDNLKNVMYHKIDSVSITGTSSLSIGSSYLEIASSESNYLYTDTSKLLGINILSASTIPFSVSTASGSTWSYPSDASTTLELIKKSEITDKLSHSIQLLYGTTSATTSTPFELLDTSGQPFVFDNTATAVLPLPPGLAEGATGTYYAPLSITHGLVTSGSTTPSSVPVASTSTIGGFKVYNGSDNTKIWLLVDNDGNAYVNTSLDVFRVDMNGTTYKDNPQNFTSTLYLFEHIGNTTVDFIHGYFYKSVVSPYTRGDFVTYTQTVYSFTDVTKLENENYKRGRIFNFSNPLTIKVTLEWAAETTVKPALSDLIFRIELSTSPGFYIEFPYSSLANFGFALLLSSLAETSSAYTLNFTITQNSPAYAWKLWNVQPVAEWGTDLIELITNAEIDTIVAS